MSTGPTRKKSLVGANGSLPQIDIPQATNQLLNKSAATSTSLYQQCSALLSILTRVHGFTPFLTANANHRQSTSNDPVNQLWDCLALGIPLCFLYNLLPYPHLDINTNPSEFDHENIKEKKRATAKFIIAITSLKNNGAWEGPDNFTISELHSETRNTNGFVKVVGVVSHLVTLLPQDSLMPELPPSPPLPSAVTASTGTGFHSAISLDSSVSSAETERNQVLRELIETERKYVGDLEVMREYATALGTNGIMDQDTIHHLFPNLNKLLDFQRQFLIVLEGIYEQPWQQQRWGNAFTSKEDEFAVYEPYCANYTSASELLLVEEQNLMALCNMIHPRSELPAFLIKPVQRICKYPLLLESLAKKVTDDYQYKDELLEGVATAKRIADQVNEAQRRAENIQTVKLLEQRVEDWKGHHLQNFGELLLDEVFFVTKGEVDREYHVFLFEKIILCCKEATLQPNAAAGGTAGRKMSKTSSILKKNDKPGPFGALPVPSGKKKNTPLLLKGRIFLNNVTAATASKKDGHALQVWWKGDDELEYFTLKCRTEEQLKQWETTINKLIRESQAKRAADTRSIGSVPPPLSVQGYPGKPGHYPPQSASAAQMSYHQAQGGYRGHEKTQSGQSYHQQQPPYGRGRFTSAPNSQYGDYPVAPATAGVYPTGMSYNAGLGLRGVEGGDSAPTAEEEAWLSEDNRGYESPYGSGRATPSGSRKGPAHMSASLNGRAPLSRGMSGGSDASFGAGGGSLPQRPNMLRSQFSSTRLRTAYDEQQPQRGISPYPHHAAQQQQYQQRMRSASTPTAYTPQGTGQQPPPPIPINGGSWASKGTSISTATSTITSNTSKRESGSSASTNESSEYSVSQSTSPITPYGSNDSSLASQTVRGKRSQQFHQQSQTVGYSGGSDVGAFTSPPIKVKVHFKEDLFVIIVHRGIEYGELMEKVGKKIRLCGGVRNESQAFRMRYRDEDGDMIALAGNDDLQIALDAPQVTLYVV
ncbi:hypothetical protein FRC03_002384 [Tulasnella sp. 419]|nr:hypothetical protein FRC03_002384 [Tulasnella sp. 419]